MKTNYATQLSATMPLGDSLTIRQREVENALLVQALCGRQPSSTVVAQLRRYEAGELSREQAFADLYREAH